MKHLLLLVALVLCSISPSLAQWVEPPQFEWARTVNSPSEMLFEGMEVGADGRVYVCGFFKDQICFEDTVCFFTTGQEYDDDIFVACYDSTGLLLWAKTFGENSEDRARDIALDSDGNLLVAGRFSHTVWFDQIPAIPYGPAGLFICKISPNGQVLDVHVISGDFYEVLQHLEVDQENNIWIAGHFSSDTLHFGDVSLVRDLDKVNERFIAKISNTYSTQIAQKLPFESDILDLKTDIDNNLILNGTFGDTLIYQGNLISSGENRHSYIMKLSQTGEYLWSVLFPRNFLTIRSLEVDLHQNIYISGGAGTAFNLGAYFFAGYAIIKLSSEGEIIWGYSFEQDRYNGRGLWSSGEVIYTIGPFSFEQVIEDTIIYSSGNFPSALSSDILMLRHSSETGELEWFKHVGWTGDEAGGYLKGNTRGNLYVTGGFTSSFTLLDSIQLRNPFPGQNSIFVARLKQDSLPPTLQIPQDGWLIYPNPVQDILWIAGQWEDGEATIDLFSMDGRLVMNKWVQTDADFSRVSIHVPSELATGMYLIRIQQGKQTRSYKIQVSHSFS